MFVKIESCEKIAKGYKIKIEYPENTADKIYPDGKGGQLGDRGTINGIKILEVKEDEIIIENPLEQGEYEVIIDEKRREDIAVQHSVEHLFSGIALKDYNLNNVGFRMGEEISTVDLDSDCISEETVIEITEKINEAISKGAEICEKIVNHEEAPNITGLRKALSSKIVGKIRLVEIENYDFCACAGFHVKNIKDIKIFKMISHERIKGKYTRFTFMAGERAIKDYNKKADIIKTLNHKFSCRDFEIIEKIDNHKKEFENLKKSHTALLQNYAELLGNSLLENPLEINSYKVIIFNGEKDIVDNLRKFFGNKDITFIGMGDDVTFLSSQSINCAELIKEIISFDNTLKGGGGANQGNLKGKITEELILKAIENITKQ